MMVWITIEEDGHERYTGYFRGEIDDLVTNWMKERKKSKMASSI